MPDLKTDTLEKVERQELHCHNCDKHVQFNIDLSMNGNHVLKCPNCGHEHCRVVKDGIISDIRWDSRNGPPPNGLPVIMVTGNITYTTTSTYGIYGGQQVQGQGTGGTTGQQTIVVTAGQTYTANIFLYQAWSNTATAT